jgi:hypothetical protein
MKRIVIINEIPFYHPYSCGEMQLESMSFKADCPTISLVVCIYLNAPIRSHLSGVITNFRGQTKISDMKMPLECSVISTATGVHSIIGCLSATLPSIDLNVLVFPSRVHCIAFIY